MTRFQVPPSFEGKAREILGAWSGQLQKHPDWKAAQFIKHRLQAIQACGTTPESLNAFEVSGIIATMEIWKAEAEQRLKDAR